MGGTAVPRKKENRVEKERKSIFKEFTRNLHTLATRA